MQDNTNNMKGTSDRQIQVFDVVVVGAGFAGLYMVHSLQEAGFSVQGIEAGGDVGGTWYWNRYPGARCDIPSLYYSYTWSDDLREEWHWKEKYGSQGEILEYLNFVANRFDLRRHYLFDRRVKLARFDDEGGFWVVETEEGERIQANFCIMATGCLSVPREPDIKGAENFQGETYHTGRWPHENVYFKGKRVALIGTGSSGIQALPIIAEQASEVCVFQRTPNYSLPSHNAPLTKAEIESFKSDFPAYKAMLDRGELTGYKHTPDVKFSEQKLKKMNERLWSGGGFLELSTIPNIVYDIDINNSIAEFVRGKISETVDDPETAEKLTPRDHPIAAKRPCIDTNYYQSFNRDNVSLIDIRETPIQEITAEGVRTSEALYDMDMIVFATGFDAITGAMLNIDIRGRNGRALKDEWNEGPKTYLGLSIAGFPNLFTIHGPGSPSVISNMITSGEQHVEWIMDCLTHLRDNGIQRIEVKTEAQENWVEHVNQSADNTLLPRANSWYLGANIPGKPRVFMPYVGENYRKYCDAEIENHYKGFSLTA